MTIKKISKNLMGLRFGKLVVISFEGYLGSEGHPKHAHWKGLCDCGNFRVVRATKLTRGVVVACTPCSHAAANFSGRFTRMKKSSPMMKLWGHYQRNARQKSLSFSLKIEEFQKLITSDCFYCGVPPCRETKSTEFSETLMTNGIDRVENSKGYEGGNVVPCCSQCNYAKRDMSVSEFRAWGLRLGQKIMGAS